LPASTAFTMSDDDQLLDVGHRLSWLVDRLEQTGLERSPPRVLRALIAAAAYDWSRFQADRDGPPRESNAHAQRARATRLARRPCACK